MKYLLTYIAALVISATIVTFLVFGGALIGQLVREGSSNPEEGYAMLFAAWVLISFPCFWLLNKDK